MSWELHPARESFAQFAADWDRLNTELFAKHPYYDSRFVGPLLQYFAGDRERLCLYRVDGSIQAALILQPRGGGRWVTFRPAQAQITPLLVGDSSLLNQLFGTLPGFAWSIEFHAVDPRFSPKFTSARSTVLVSERYTTISISPESGFDTYWEQRPKKLRSNLRRHANRLERESVAAEVNLIKSPQAMADGVRRFGELESKGWKAVEGTAVSIDNVQGGFYAEVLANFAANGDAEIYELAMGDQTAASRMLIGNEQMLVSLKINYDEALARFAPGWLLLQGMLRRQLVDHPDRTIEFYTKASREQSEWATDRYVIQDIHMFRDDTAMALFTLAKSMLRPLQWLRSSSTGQESSKDLMIGFSNDIKGLPEERTADWCSPRTSIEASLDWFELLHSQVYPDDQGVIYSYACEGGRLRAVLPLRQTRHIGVRTLGSLSNYYTSQYAPLLSAEAQPRVLQAMLTSAARQSGGAHVMRFVPMDSESSEYAGLLQAVRNMGWVAFPFFCFGNWYLRVEGGWDSYLKNRSGNLRGNIKRANRKFSEAGGTLEVVTSSENLDEAIAAYNQVYAASWKKPEPYPDFVPSLIKLVAAKGMLRLGIARLKGVPVAAQLWIVGRDKASIYKVAYDETYADYSPGTVLTSFLMQHVIEADFVAEVDFLIGDDKYKQLWMSHRRERWGIIAYNPRTVLGCLLLIKELAGRTIKPLVSKYIRLLKNTRTKFLHWLPSFARSTNQPQNNTDKKIR